MKQPAFMFYTSDFLTGTMLMTYEQKGQYITLLCLQHQKGHLSINDINKITFDEEVISKFDIDDEGKYFNKRLDDEMKKRALYSEHQRENVLKRWKKDTTVIPSYDVGNTIVIPLENEYVYNSLSIDRDRGVGEEKESINETIYEVVTYLNEKATSSYKPTSTKTRQLIQARTNEGFNVDDFKKVIDNKVNDWLGTEMEKFLRPETLFSNKFEGYLNQKIIKKESNFDKGRRLLLND